MGVTGRICSSCWLSDWLVFSLLAVWGMPGLVRLAVVLVEAMGGSTVNEGVGSLKAGVGTLVDVVGIAGGTGAKGDDVDDS